MAAVDCDLMIHNGAVYPVDAQRNIYCPGAVAITDARIAAVGPEDVVRRACRPRRAIDARGAIVHPGLIDAHLHVTAHLSRGVIEQAFMSGAGSYAAWFDGLTAEDEYANALAAAAELVRNGFSCFMEAGTACDTDAVAEAVEAVGARASLTDPFIWDLADAGNPIAPLVRRVRPDRRQAMGRLGAELKRRGSAPGRIHAHVGLYGSCSASPELLRAAKALAREAGVVLCQHQNFSAAQALADDRRFGGEHAIGALAGLGIIDERTTLVHMNHLRGDELDVLRAARPSIVWQPANYLFYGVHRTSPTAIPMLRREGLAVALGSDVPKAWSFGDMAQLAHLVAAGQAEPLSSHDLLDMQTAAGARALGLEREIGRIAPGMRADIVIRRPGAPEDLPGIDPLLHALLISRGRSVDTVLVDGVEVVRDGRLIRTDESMVCERALRSASRMAAVLDVSPAGRKILERAGGGA